MKTVGVLVLLLASVHVFTPVSSDDSGQSHESVPVPPILATTRATTPTRPPATHAPTANTLPVMSVSRSTDAPVRITHKPPEDGKTATPTASAAPKTTVAPTSSGGAGTGNQTSKNVTIPGIPTDTSNPGNNSNTNTTGQTTIQGPHESTQKPITGPEPGSTAKVPLPEEQQDETTSGAGSQTGNHDKEPAKSDKRLWWILLPIALVGAAAAIILKFKSKKIHDHTETIDTGTENASFQSRPESTKDGVMLLGVKSSGAEENAAAR